MDKYQITIEQLRALLQDRIDWSVRNPDFIQTKSSSLKYAKEKLGVFVDYHDIPEKYINASFNQILPLLDSIGITTDGEFYYITVDAYDSFLYEVRRLAIIKQILERPDIQFVIDKDDRIYTIRTELKVP